MYRPPETQPRKFININNDSSHFYHYSDSTILFDDGRGRNGSFMPPFAFQQTFICPDRTSFTFYPDGSGHYDNGRGHILFIPAGAYVRLPSASPASSNATSSAASVIGVNSGRWPVTAISATRQDAALPLRRTLVSPTRRTREPDDASSDDDDSSSDGYDDLVKFGIRRTSR